MEYKIINTNCLDAMSQMQSGEIDAIVTDPPYGLSFMGANWDHNVPGVAYWSECLRVAKPGAHLLCFGGTRTFHRLMCAIEDAGWEIRDTIMWVYGSGFPKSMNVSKAIDKTLGAKRTVVGEIKKLDSYGYDSNNTYGGGPDHNGIMEITAPATSESAEWEGWGTCLKPAWEPIIVARKPLDGTVAHNVMTYGTGAINIDGCRIPTSDVLSFGSRQIGDGVKYGKCTPTTEGKQNDKGRFPANLVHDGSQEVVGLFPVTKGQKAPVKGIEPSRDARDGIFPTFGPINAFEPRDGYSSAARFFYCAKASKRDRGEGNDHPTVKPNALMRWLVRLVCPQGGMVLDPFMGSGSTGVACIQEGMRFVGVEMKEHYCEIAENRIGAAQ